MQNQQFESNYPRPSEFRGLPVDRLRALGEGYFGLNWVCLANVLCMGSQLLLMTHYLAGLVSLLIQMVLIAAVSYPHAKKLTYAFGSAPAMAIVVPILLTFNSFFCLGLVGLLMIMNRAKSFLTDEGYPPKILQSRKTFNAFLESVEMSTPAVPSAEDRAA